MTKEQLTKMIKEKSLRIGFNAVGITMPAPGREVQHLDQWLESGHEGEMTYMKRNQPLLKNPKHLMPEVKSIISVSINYLSSNDQPEEILNSPKKAYIARYALGRDYHKILRSKLKALANHINDLTNNNIYKAAVDSAPLLEKAYAERSGIGWIGKNTNLINSKSGSFFMIGELLTSIELVYDIKATNHCGSCKKCIDICPTKAFNGPYSLDARKCISYLTIENKNEIPTEHREAIGNRIFGCDDCQIYCPWNKFAQHHNEDDFNPRHSLDRKDLIDLFQWTEKEWSDNTLGSAIRRAGYDGWRRNISVALGNAPYEDKTIRILEQALGKNSKMVDEHIMWAINTLKSKSKRKLKVIN